MDKDILAYQTHLASQQGAGSLPPQYQQYILGTKAPAARAARTGLGSIIGGTVGGLAGGALGTFLMPGAGTVGGGIAGGAAGSALGEAIDQLFTGGHISSGKQIGEEALLGAAPGVLGTGAKLVKGARAGLTAAEVLGQGGKAALTAGADAAGNAASKYSVEGGLKNAANRVLASQYGTISKPVARQTNLVETIGTLAGRGITKPGDAERIAQQITGGNGLVSNAVTKAIGNKATINATDLGKIAGDLSTEHMLNDTQIKSVGKFVNALSGRLSTGKADDAMAAVRQLESKVADLTGKGGTYHLPTSENVAQAKVLSGVADALKERIYGQADIKSVLTPDLQKNLLALHPGNKKWADFVSKDIMGAGSIAELRKAQSAFVKVGKAIEEGDVNAVTAGGRVGNSLAGGALGQAINAVAGTQVAKRAAAGTLNAAGTVAGSGAAKATGKVGGSLAIQGGERAAVAPFMSPGGIMARGEAGNKLANDNFSAAPDMSALANDQNVMDYNAAMNAGMGQDAQGADASNDPFSTENLKMMALQDIQNTGGKNLDKIVTLSKLFSTETKTKPLGATQAKDANLAASGLRALDALEQLGSQDTNAHIKAALPGQIGAHDYAAARREAMDAIVRLRTGAAMSKSEEAFYTKMFPGATDSPETAARKIAQLRQYLMGAAQPNPAGIDPTDLINSFQG